ncbi:LytR C-terminal domain-containing protein [Nesterenkonia cremea]|uniref:LytR/CpsA/Psr regulator C-terminal domain-containing protein n=1 Tax=Nesterenkonia cremea TaxID=1882340 RepID=A0A917ATQ9_9MICC|nr:LytR C-terminal domain-containing protein [Nesterenkonia cremea]GGE73854.1 hypothetical protein GCM10011401_21350 [Nesterenkonia cremea]
MSQHPHDEFDDVPPYQSGEAGKHRAPGAAAGGAAAGGGGLKWIGLLAAVVLVVGLFSWLVFGDDDDTETTAGDQGAAEEQGDADQDDGDDAEGDAAQDEDGQDEAAQGEEGQDDAAQGEEGQGEEETEVDMETPVQVFNHQGPEGTAASAESQLEEQGYNVTALNNWEWDAQTTPVIYHSAEDAEFAQQLASDMGIDNLQESDQFTTVAVVVGEEYAPGQ